MSSVRLEDHSRVAVIGGGPAGSFFSYFLLDMAQRVGKQVTVDVYEARDFDRVGPAGCNNCGGIISEWLVQALAADGINLPTDVVERGIDSYVLHTDLGDVRIAAPLQEKRIGAVHRGAGPRGITNVRFRGFDSFVLQQARAHGANVVHGRVDGVEMRDGRPHLKVRGEDFQGYDLLAVAMGKNNAALKMFDALHIGYRPPKATKTYISEIPLGHETVSQCLGSSMHVFLLNMPRVEFAALIPKGDYATLCVLGHEIDTELVKVLVASPQVKQCLPAGWVMPSELCHCSPVICIEGAVNPFADRVVFVGDCGVTRLYKDGIGAAYRTAKAAAVTAVFEGIAAEDFRRHYDPLLRDITIDNKFGRAIFSVTRVIQRVSLLRRGVLRTVAGEQQQTGGLRRMSMVLWDTFTGSAPYRDVFMRTLHPAFGLRFLWNIAAATISFARRETAAPGARVPEALGEVYRDGEVIVRQGDAGDNMFVIQAGQVEVVEQKVGREVRLAVLTEGEFFGEMALVERQERSATVRAVGEARVLTVDNRTFHRRVREDPSLAYRILRTLSHRVQELDNAVTEAKPAVALSIPGEAGARAGRPATTETPGQSPSLLFRPGAVIARQGEAGDCMYFIQSGRVEVVQERDGREVRLAESGAGEFFGEMAIFQRQERSATVRALTETRVEVLDTTTFLRRVHEDASLGWPDAYLLSLGVPQDWLPTVRLAKSDEDLLLIYTKLPDDVAERLLALAAGELVTPRGLLSDEHFTVDGTLLEAWASQKSFQRKDDPTPPSDDDPGNPTVNFHGERRSNATHESTSDPEARLCRKGKGREAKLAYLGNLLMDNREGLAVGAQVSIAEGAAETFGALELVEALEQRAARITVGGDKLFDNEAFVEGLRFMAATPHVAQNTRAGAVASMRAPPATRATP